MRWVTSVALSVLFPMSVMAAEPGTYRPGEAYNSTMMLTPQACAQSCEGDMRCQGWNFVKARADISGGVCELNARMATPVPSAISMSAAKTHRTSSVEIIPSGTHVTRIGAVPQAAARPLVVKPRPARRIVREPVPEQIVLDQKVEPVTHQAPINAAHRRQLIAAQRAAFIPAKTVQPKPVAIPPVAPRPQAQAAPPAPIATLAQVQAAPRPQRRGPARRARSEERSLFGSLHDDMNNIDPMPTVKAAPVKPVEADPYPEMAGGR